MCTEKAKIMSAMCMLALSCVRFDCVCVCTKRARPRCHVYGTRAKSAKLMSARKEIGTRGQHGAVYMKWWLLSGPHAYLSQNCVMKVHTVFRADLRWRWHLRGRSGRVLIKLL